MNVYVVIPALNEAEAIGAVIAAIPAEFGASVLVVDNGSTDATAERARSAGAVVLRTDTPGYGRACAFGADYALTNGADVVVFLDGDFSDDPREMHALLDPLRRDEADLVLGSRLRGTRSVGAMPWYSVVGNRLVSQMMNTIYGTALTDLGPFRAIRATLLRELGMQEMTYGWPVEMLAKASRTGARIFEIPASYRRRIGRSKISGTLGGALGATYFLLTRTLLYARWRPGS